MQQKLSLLFALLIAPTASFSAEIAFPLAPFTKDTRLLTGSFPPAGPVTLPSENTDGPGYAGEKFTAKVLFVIDGDSLRLNRHGKLVEVRIAEIDTPEYDQPYGSAAKNFAFKNAANRTVLVEVLTIDRYQRRVAKITLPTGEMLHRALLRAGLAWWYRYYSDDESLGVLEQEARESRRGLWRDPAPVPPWTHRRNRRRQGLPPIDPLEL